MPFWCNFGTRHLCIVLDARCQRQNANSNTDTRTSKLWKVQEFMEYSKFSIFEQKVVAKMFDLFLYFELQLLFLKKLKVCFFFKLKVCLKSKFL